MTIKDAVLKSLEELKIPVNSLEICEYILANKFFEFSGKTPAGTVSAMLGEFIRNNDSRIKRIKNQGRVYLYY